jgi:hypothetical protein
MQTSVPQRVQRNSWTDDFDCQAMDEGPEDFGPLCGHALTVFSLLMEHCMVALPTGRL